MSISLKSHGFLLPWANSQEKPEMINLKGLIEDESKIIEAINSLQQHLTQDSSAQERLKSKIALYQAKNTYNTIEKRICEIIKQLKPTNPNLEAISFEFSPGSVVHLDEDIDKLGPKQIVEFLPFVSETPLFSLLVDKIYQKIPLEEQDIQPY